MSVLISLAFWGVLGYCFYYVFTKDLFDLSNYLYASVWILGTLIFSVFEYSFYAIIITKKFQDSEGKNRISFGQDIQIWWHAFGTYFQYITYFSSILFLGIILLIL